MKTKVLSFICDMKTYNVGQYMTNGGLILASIGVVSALIGNRIRINTVDDRVIIGGENLEKFLAKHTNRLSKMGPNKDSFFLRLYHRGCFY